MPFFVRRPSGRPEREDPLLAPTGDLSGLCQPRLQLRPTRFNEMLAKPPGRSSTAGAAPRPASELGRSLYDLHSDGSGICYSSRLRPVLNMRPMATLTAGLGSMLWHYNADTHITDWLEAQGFAFDVVTDEDLHAEGARRSSAP